MLRITPFCCIITNDASFLLCGIPNILPTTTSGGVRAEKLWGEAWCRNWDCFVRAQPNLLVSAANIFSVSCLVSSNCRIGNLTKTHMRFLHWLSCRSTNENMLPLRWTFALGPQIQASIRLNNLIVCKQLTCPFIPGDSGVWGDDHRDRTAVIEKEPSSST